MTFFIKKKAVTDTKLDRAKQSLTDTRAQRTKNRETLKKYIHKRKKHNDNTEQQQATPKPMNLAETTQLNLQKELHRNKYEDL